MNRSPIKKTCPECGGTCEVPDPFYEGYPAEQMISCDNCIKGEVYNYLTPEQWEAETGEKMLDSDPVWYQCGSDLWKLAEYWMFKQTELNCIVARPGQPKPPEDYRP